MFAVLTQCYRLEVATVKESTIKRKGIFPLVLPLQSTKYGARNIFPVWNYFVRVRKCVRAV